MARGRKPKCFGDFTGEAPLRRFNPTNSVEHGWSAGQFYCISLCPHAFECAEETETT
ncbi:MAG: hypothetical protein OEZ48_00275 [Candidatus Bathyarchaeota archaeon]|nr:hypothetical protein [Candidatus Bathyarchaeota archaeon]